MEPKFFPDQLDFRKWLEEHHDKEEVLWVGYYKKASKLPSMTWSESVDQALCFGWIDGLRKSIDEVSYKIRFTPRRPRSHWSDVNIKKMAELEKKGLLQPAGIAAYQKLDKKRSGQASYEQKKPVQLDEAYIEKLKANSKAWAYFQKVAPYYKKAATHWVMSAKKEETRLRRLNILIESSEQGLKIPPMRR